ncbi:hypothetical protein GCM10022252_26610 [Streptosporangium oxazolinicum]|uniref:Uncharacterized protein n=1 Tax=Streptosporangium oxazolinicum TaxID=909287 RepID=A0ABP8ASP7_9ACTN
MEPERSSTVTELKVSPTAIPIPPLIWAADRTVSVRRRTAAIRSPPPGETPGAVVFWGFAVTGEVCHHS